MQAISRQPLVSPLRFPALDGYPLAGELHRPAGAARGAVLIASAMGVPRRYYAPFASWLAEAGLLSLTFDYRGIGGSAPPRLRGFPARLQDWADLDLPAAAAALRREAPSLPLLWMGHSVGGQLFGLVRGVDVQGALLVGSQSGHWRNWETPWGRLAIWGLWHLVIPALAPTLGRLPMRAFRQGEDLPAGVALQWATWGRDRDYALGFARREGREEAFSYRGPMRFVAVSDDRFAPPRTVEALRVQYAGAASELDVVRPGDLGLRRLGHFGPFRQLGRERLWPVWRDWLLARC